MIATFSPLRCSCVLALLACAGVGCGFSAHGTAIDGGTDDVPRDVPPGNFCYGSGAGFRLCLATEPTGTYTVSGPTTFDTDSECTSTQTPPGGPTVCIKSAATITISDQLTVHGTRPLVLLAATQITIAGVLDVASHRGGTRGPGANDPGCSQSTAASASANGGGGGAGGSFGTKGGEGGRGDNGNTTAGGAGTAATSPAAVRGGCAGGNGGAGGTGALGGGGGDGGGAVYVVSGGGIAIPGTINASGASGTASAIPLTGNGGGAGGAGSGGMIALFAAVTLNATGGKLLANGAGGAEGGDKPHDCAPGQDPSPTPPLLGGGGGSGVCGAGGDGGNGGSAGVVSQNGAQGGEGGGGGGGGVGVILVVSGQPLTGAIVSP